MQYWRVSINYHSINVTSHRERTKIILDLYRMVNEKFPRFSEIKHMNYRLAEMAAEEIRKELPAIKLDIAEAVDCRVLL